MLYRTIFLFLAPLLCTIKTLLRLFNIDFVDLLGACQRQFVLFHVLVEVIHVAELGALLEQRLTVQVRRRIVGAAV